MTAPTFENINPIVANVAQQGASLTVTFRCPITEKTVQSRAMMRRQQQGVGSALRRSLIRNIMWSLRRQLFKFLGRGVQGRIASDVATQALRGAGEKFQYSRADKNNAIVQAFTKVQNEFVWDPQTDHWIHTSAQELV